MDRDRLAEGPKLHPSGFSLYAYNGRAGNQGHRVSDQRPPLSQFSNWEQPFVEWAERNGFVLEYATNGDLDEIAWSRTEFATFRPDAEIAAAVDLFARLTEFWVIEGC